MPKAEATDRNVDLEVASDSTDFEVITPGRLSPHGFATGTIDDEFLRALPRLCRFPGILPTRPDLMRFGLSGWLSLGCALAIAIGFLAPKEMLSLPGGLAKPAHYLAYLFLGFTLARARGWRDFDWFALVLCVALGLVLEMSQWLVPGRTFNLSDLGLNTAGALSGAALAAVLQSTARSPGTPNGGSTMPLADRIKRQGGIPQQTQWLLAHRLAPLVRLLGGRGSVPNESMAAIAPFADRLGMLPDHCLEEEVRVLSQLEPDKGSFLILKGALLAWRYYPDPRTRYRTDLDLLVERHALKEIRDALHRLGYHRGYEVAGDAPLTQEPWIHQRGGHRYLVDLHWDLRNHPALQQLFTFAELHACGESIPVGEVSVPGLGPAHALLHGVMHWFDDLGQERPLVWLLDMDLIWRTMSEEQRRWSVDLAIEKGLAGLLAHCLAESRATFETPVDPQVLTRLRRDGGTKRITGLIRARESKWRSYWHAARSEKSWTSSLRHVRWLLIPPRDYLLARHGDEGADRTRLSLYLKRLKHGLRK